MGLNWDDLRFVLALKRGGSLGAAARLLKVEQSTASRRLSSLEEALGVQLVARTPEGLVLSTAGQTVAELAEGIDGRVEEVRRHISGEDQRPEGQVRLSTTETMANFVMPGLVPLREQYPKLQVQLVVNSAALDLMRREADLALRLFRETSPTLIARKIGVVGWSLFASRTYLERNGAGRAGSLEGHAVIGHGGAIAKAVGGLWLAKHSRVEDVVLTCESVASVLNAVKAGLGVSPLPCFAAHHDAALVRLTPEVIDSTEAFLVIPPDHKDTVRVRLVMDALSALFERERKVLEGSA